MNPGPGDESRSLCRVMNPGPGDESRSLCGVWLVRAGLGWGGVGSGGMVWCGIVSMHLERVGLETFGEVHRAARKRTIDVEGKRISQRL